MMTIKIIAMACDKTRTEVVQKELVASTTQDNSTSLNPQKTSWYVVFVGDVIYIGLETHLRWFEWERRELTSPAPEAATS